MKELHDGHIRNHIIRLSWPMVLVNVFQNAGSMYELFLVGRLGLESLAALSIVMSGVYLLFFSVHGGLINGALAITSRLSGRKHFEQLNTAVVQMLYFAAAVFLVFTAACFAAAEPILAFFGAKGEVMQESKEFLRVLPFSVVPITLFTIFLAALRGAGDSITPLWVVILMVTVNAVMNTVLVGIMKIGIKGVIISNVTSWAAAGIAFLVIFVRGIHFFRIKPENLKPDLKIMKSYAGISLKAILQNFVGDTGTILMLKLIAGYGNAFIAAFGVVVRLIFFLNMFGWPIGNSGGIIAGHNLGAGNKARAKQTVLEGIKVISFINVTAMFLFFLFPKEVMAMFSNDTRVIEYGSAYMKIMAGVLPFLGAGVIIQAAFNGAGSTGRPTIINLISFIAVRFSLALLLIHIPAIGRFGIFWATAGSVAVYAAISWLVYLRGKWLEKEI